MRRKYCNSEHTHHFGPPRPMKRFFGSKGFGPMMPRGIHGHPLMGLHMVEEIEDKEEAIELLEIQTKYIEKARERLEKRKEHLNLMEDHLEISMKEIGKMKEFSTDNLKKILKKQFKEFQKNIIDLED